MLKISQLNSGYDDLQVLHDVNLEIEQGQVAVLMGPNGAGKSTLLKSIFNLVPVTSGTIEFNNILLSTLPTHALLEQGISYVPQGKVNFGTLTIQENLFLGGYHIEDTALAKKNIDLVIQEFPLLQEKWNEYAFKLSGGQQQMLAIARAMVTIPKLLLLDEPSLGLSPRLVKEVFAKIKHINQTFGVTVLIVEHNIKSALAIADVGYIMAQGKIIAHDTAKNLKISKILEQVFVGAME